MASGDVTFQISTITMGGNAMDMPIGCSLTQRKTPLPVIYATEVFAQVVPSIAKGVDSMLIGLNVGTETGFTQDYKGTLAINLVEADGGTAVLSCTNQLVLDVIRNMQAPPYNKVVTTTNEGTPTFSAAT